MYRSIQHSRWRLVVVVYSVGLSTTNFSVCNNYVINNALAAVINRPSSFFVTSALCDMCVLQYLVVGGRVVHSLRGVASHATYIIRRPPRLATNRCAARPVQSVCVCGTSPVNMAGWCAQATQPDLSTTPPNTPGQTRRPVLIDGSR